MTACPGCGLVLPAEDGPTHAYIGASPACWARFGELLAREFQDPARFAVHSLTVDTYAVQHPGGDDPRAVRSVAVHLASLGAVVERGADPASAPGLIGRIAGRIPAGRLEPPAPNGTITVADVLESATAEEHVAAVRGWAADVWAAWEAHHATVRARLDAALAESEG